MIVRPTEEGNYWTTICRHCPEPKCAEVCPVPGALKEDESTGAYRLDRELCIACKLCVEACPYGAILTGPDGELLKCDLCGGPPACVEACSKSHRPKDQKALAYADCASIAHEAEIE